MVLLRSELEIRRFLLGVHLVDDRFPGIFAGVVHLLVELQKLEMTDLRFSDFLVAAHFLQELESVDGLLNILFQLRKTLERVVDKLTRLNIIIQSITKEFYIRLFFQI